MNPAAGPGLGGERLPLTLLYVPADRPDRIPKAFAAGADVVIIDLEDAVSPALKETARQHAVEAAASAPGACQVRVNAAGTPWHDDDLDAVRALPASVGLRLPKCDDRTDLARIVAQTGDRPLHLLIESARGLESAYDLARAHPSVASIGLGEADLRADLGVTDEAGLAWARSRVVCAAAAAGLPSPTMPVFADVADEPGLRESCRTGRALGMVGRTAIHPRQLTVIREVFTPTDAELARAREVLEAASGGTAAGVGAIALPDGRFVDEAVVRQARRLLAQAPPEPTAT